MHAQWSHYFFCFTSSSIIAIIALSFCIATSFSLFSNSNRSRSSWRRCFWISESCLCFSWAISESCLCFSCRKETYTSVVDAAFLCFGVTAASSALFLNYGGLLVELSVSRCYWVKVLRYTTWVVCSCTCSVTAKSAGLATTGECSFGFFATCPSTSFTLGYNVIGSGDPIDPFSEHGPHIPCLYGELYIKDKEQLKSKQLPSPTCHLGRSQCRKLHRTDYQSAQCRQHLWLHCYPSLEALCSLDLHISVCSGLK